MNFDQRDLNIIGHWPSSSRMPERYDREVCAAELLLRNTIIQKFVSGWGLAPSFHLPETVTGHHRIGKEAPLRPPNQTEDLPGPTPVDDTVLAGAEQETPPPVATPQKVNSAVTENESSSSSLRNELSEIEPTVVP